MTEIVQRCTGAKIWTLKVRLQSIVTGRWPGGKVKIEVRPSRPATVQSRFTFTKFKQETSGLAKFIGRRKGDVTLTLVFEADDTTWELAAPMVIGVDEGQVITATIDIRMNMLRVILVDVEGQPLANHTWSLTAPVTANGTTGNDGLIEVVCPAQGKSATLITTPPAPPLPPPTTTAPLSSPAPYPPPIIPTQFEDEATAAPPNGGRMEWTAALGELPTGPAGVFVRLHNLGYAGNGKTTHPLATELVKSYQSVVLQQDAPSGSAASIAASLTQRHDEA